MLIVAIWGYGIGTTILSFLGRKERFQNAFMIGGVTLGVLCAVGLDLDFEGTLLSVLPGFLLFSLILSTLCHWALGKEVEVLG